MSALLIFYLRAASLNADISRYCLPYEGTFLTFLTARAFSIMPLRILVFISFHSFPLTIVNLRRLVPESNKAIYCDYSAVCLPASTNELGKSFCTITELVKASLQW